MPVMSATRPLEDQDALERARINQETARLPWRELQRFFAQGRVIAVDRAGTGSGRAGAAAVRVTRRRLSPPIWSRDVWRRSATTQARAWLEADAEVWAVVVKPWVLVQDRA
jgi:hypothetical protein